MHGRVSGGLPCQAAAVAARAVPGALPGEPGQPRKEAILDRLWLLQLPLSFIISLR